MNEQEIEVRLAGMVPACMHMAIGSLYNIARIEDEMVWCYCRSELFGDHPGMVQLVSPDHIKIMLEGIVVDGELGPGTIHELKYSPKLTHRNLFCFSFSKKESEFYTAEVAREKFLIELGVNANQHRVLNQVFPVGSFVEENTRLINILQYKKPK